jgi:hypothetical protein
VQENGEDVQEQEETINTLGERDLDPTDNGSIPFVVFVYNLHGYTIAAEVVFKLTQAGLDAWRLKTYEALATASAQQWAEYEERLAAAQVASGIAISGRNPLENRLVERNELKRLAIIMLTWQYFAQTATTITDHPSFNPLEALAKGAYARFFEEAFDWPNMIYEFLPYFWAQAKTWDLRLIANDADPLHAAFLRAGAARLRFAVTPGFERAVLHFLETGNIPYGNTSHEPAVTFPRHVGFLAEIDARRAEETETEIPVDEPWEIRLPTTLVRLRQSVTLPAWEQDEDGNWLPVPEV